MTSNHECVSCDLCRKNNFKGLRYKCLVCYDYDLCSVCYDAGLTSSRHTVDHPMQCIVARNDFELFYGGETRLSDHPVSLTCPLCGNLGYTEATLLEHVTNEHANTDNDDSSAGIVCPICGVETNQLTYDFATHLTMEHRTPRDQLEQITIRGRGGRGHTRTSGPRGRRAQPHYNPIGGPSGSSPSSSARDTDPLVQILARLSSVSRVNGANSDSNNLGSSRIESSISSQSPASQLHQLQMRIASSPSFSSRTAASVSSQDRAQAVRLPRRIDGVTTANALSNSIGSLGGGAYATGVGTHYNSSQSFVLMDCSLARAGIVSSGTVGSNGCSGITGRHAATTTTGSGLGAGLGAGGIASGVASINGNAAQVNWPSQDGSNQTQFPAQYLLSSCMKPTLSETEQQQREVLKADRSLFVQDLLLQVGSRDEKQLVL